MNCNQANCSNVASYLFTWPGSDEAGICAEHVGKLRGIAAAMGLPLQVKPLTVGNLLDEAIAAKSEE
jgi:hypothetical protein